MMPSLVFTLAMLGSLPVPTWSAVFVRIVNDEMVLPSTPTQRGRQHVWKTPLPSTR